MAREMKTGILNFVLTHKRVCLKLIIAKGVVKTTVIVQICVI